MNSRYFLTYVYNISARGDNSMTIKKCTRLAEMKNNAAFYNCLGMPSLWIIPAWSRLTGRKNHGWASTVEADP